ncbi:hypothetical protein E2C01_022090 [Portunus trituberculatus]|uniref:Uncharacterized protein n=1 Tax=Portunus trituberculatus TaxID=210409 RepID=A0A5B7E6B2_PORTR|nr:hypothetical protein [Portunus trituberculatus]
MLCVRQSPSVRVTLPVHHYSLQWPRSEGDTGKQPRPPPSPGRSIQHKQYCRQFKSQGVRGALSFTRLRNKCEQRRCLEAGLQAATTGTLLLLKWGAEAAKGGARLDEVGSNARSPLQAGGDPESRGKGGTGTEAGAGMGMERQGGVAEGCIRKQGADGRACAGERRRWQQYPPGLLTATLAP